MLWEYLKTNTKKFGRKQIADSTKTISYENILSQAEAFARELNSSRYAILCKSELNTAIAILGCFAAGATALPLSMRYGEQHCKKILGAMSPEYIITDAGGELAIESSGYEQKNNKTKAALIMCTSGTSGNPKGALITDENILSNLLDIKRYFKIGETDNILIVRPLCHCAVLTGEFLISLVCGLNIRFLEGSFSPTNIIAKLNEFKITLMCATPSVLGLISKFAKEPINLRHIAVSGECMTKNIAKSIRKAFPDTDIYNVYGLTEASPRVAYLPPELFDKYPLSVGYPLYSVQATIVGDDGSLLPDGQIGELIVKGENIMAGYYENPDETAKSLRGGWLYTGDLAYKDRNGLIYIKGRKDNMIIRSGINIYPQEIENILQEDKRIEEVFAYGITDEICGQRIGITVAGDFADVSEVGKLCVERLPLYMVPRLCDIKLTKTLPKNASGKILRNKIQK